MASTAGLEPAACGLGNRRSIQLSYVDDTGSLAGLEADLKRREAIFGISSSPALIGLGFAATGCAPAMLLDQFRAGETGKVSLIQDGDSLSLETGLNVRLAEIEARAGERKAKAPGAFATEAKAFLTSLIAGETADLA